MIREMGSWLCELVEETGVLDGDDKWKEMGSSGEEGKGEGDSRG